MEFSELLGVVPLSASEKTGLKGRGCKASANCKASYVFNVEVLSEFYGPGQLQALRTLDGVATTWFEGGTIEVNGRTLRKPPLQLVFANFGSAMKPTNKEGDIWRKQWESFYDIVVEMEHIRSLDPRLSVPEIVNELRKQLRADDVVEGSPTNPARVALRKAVKASATDETEEGLTTIWKACKAMWQACERKRRGLDDAARNPKKPQSQYKTVGLSEFVV